MREDTINGLSQELHLLDEARVQEPESVEGGASFFGYGDQIFDLWTRWTAL